MEIFLDEKLIKVNNSISRTELLRLAGIDEITEKEAKNNEQTAGTGWEVYVIVYGTKHDRKLEENEVLNFKEDKYFFLTDRRFYTACTNTYGG